MTVDNIAKVQNRIKELSHTPTLLVACDFDGTLAPLVDDPMTSKPHRESSAALRSLAEQSNTHVSVISGRSLRDLAALSRFPEEIRLVGSHGSEFEVGFAQSLSDTQLKLKTKVLEQTQAIADEHKARLEVKPAGMAIHLRELSADTKTSVSQAMQNGPCKEPGVHVMQGKDVIELSVQDKNKGHAIERLRAQVGATAVIYFGDDTTDEAAFATLSGPDLAIKVGQGPTCAQYRIEDTTQVSQMLALLTESRITWLKGAGLVPIEDHSIISDLRTAAIITPQARITWFCAPRIDSGSVFAELLGGPTAGHFTISDPQGAATSQEYNQDTLILKTSFPNFSVTDLLDTSSGRTRRLAGRTDLIRKIEGQGRARIEFAPRLNFGRSHTNLVLKEDGIVIKGTNDLMSLRAVGVTWEIQESGSHETAVGFVDLKKGEPIYLELRCGNASLKAESQTIEDRLAETSSYWKKWANKLLLPSVETEQVKRSAIILKSLCHRPTGAILAAATTSLPETMGGVRNWDYRYCWLRDAALTAASLVRLGSNSEAMSYVDWVLKLLESRDDPERLSPLYNVAGRHLPPEAELTEMSGYGGSRPVRIGNAADGQIQLDVFGPIVDLVYLLSESGEPLSSEHWRLVKAMVLAVTRRWEESDHGIWEIRKPPRPHVYTKVMCWVTIDRAIKIADQFVDEISEEWISLRDEIAAEVLSEGWNESRRSFTAAYEGEDLDASVLAVGLYGLIDPTDPKFVATVETIETELRDGKAVYRYVEDDGLPGKEGGFNIMTSWLVESLWLVGRKDAAKELFAGICSLVGDTGLMAEQFDPVNEIALGNVPQAYSHLGLINNAVLLSE